MAFVHLYSDGLARWMTISVSPRPRLFLTIHNVGVCGAMDSRLLYAENAN